MDIFQSEQARVEDRIDDVIPLLEDVAARGRIIAEDLHIIKNAIKYPDSLGHKFIGSGLHTDDMSDKLGTVRNELDVYAEKSSVVIKELTKMLTEIRYNFSIFSSCKGQNCDSLGSWDSLLWQESAYLPYHNHCNHRVVLDIQRQCSHL